MIQAYRQFDVFAPEFCANLYQHVLANQHAFVETTTETRAVDYRKSAVLHHFEPFQSQIIEYVRNRVPLICPMIGMPNFEIHSVEAQLTAHPEGAYYKWHNDNGSETTNKRLITYVYYFNEVPQQYTGGELAFKTDAGEETIVPMHNSIIWFPSHLMHEVRVVSNVRSFASSRFTVNGWVRGY